SLARSLSCLPADACGKDGTGFTRTANPSAERALTAQRSKALDQTEPGIVIWAVVNGWNYLKSPPTLLAISPTAPLAPPPIRLSICPAIGSGNLVLTKSSTVVVAERA